MSSKLLGHVWEACAASGIKGTKLLIMARLADYSNDEGVSYPSVETIARQLGAGISTIRGAIAELESEGWLCRENRRKGNRNCSNLYYLNAERLEEIALCEIAKVKAARLAKRKAISHPPESDGSKSDPLKSGGSNDSHRPESGKKGRFDRPESGGDPQEDLDPSDKDLSSRNSDEPHDSGAKAIRDEILKRHPDAAVYTSSGKAWGTADDLRAARWMHEKILTVDASAKTPNWPEWANTIRLMRQQDRLTHREICEVFRWANAHTFWQSNILSPGKLRAQWGTLSIQRKNQIVKPSREELDWDSTDWADGLGGLL
ncbi:helix-turn-helix domain-containing protein [Dickeya oryzae]|uniref:helix-turn-helix domain-containing protein n=1 Tax=Dickeya oryzae TaxID=1240404 RepID=UPI001FED342E|nr:helix-turn-helix domain-containing protein [Dickeya oryzae]